MPVAEDFREGSMADEQRPPSMPSMTEEPALAAAQSDQGADAQAAEQAATQAAGASASAPAEAWQIDSNDLVQEARGMAQRVIAQATDQADQVTRSAGKRLTATAAAMKERMGGPGRFATFGQQAANGNDEGGSFLEREGTDGFAIDMATAAGRNLWLLLALLGLVVAFIALRRRRGGEPATSAAEASPASS
jgi:hypothetical protein